jgi:kynurenine 3-monooxygenase
LLAALAQCINSVSRARLNAHLLTRCESTPNITLHFSHPLADIDLDTGLLTFRHHASNSESWTFQADLIIGADGAYSRVRKTMMRKMRLKYEQEYIDHGYVELEIPAGEDGGWRMDPNHLHIWPKGGYMMIALPNPVSRV